MSEPDGVDEVVAGGLRVAITAAGAVAEHLARVRAERVRQVTAENTAATRAMATRLGAERAAARAQLALVDREEWWRNGRVRDIADAWETAQLWRQVEPEAERAAATIIREVRDRYGVDLEDGTPVDRDALEQAVRERQTAAVERRRAQGTGAVLEASLVLAADEANRAAGMVDEGAQAELVAELVQIERPVDLAHQVVADLRQKPQSDAAADPDANTPAAGTGALADGTSRTAAQAPTRAWIDSADYPMWREQIKLGRQKGLSVEEAETAAYAYMDERKALTQARKAAEASKATGAAAAAESTATRLEAQVTPAGRAPAGEAGAGGQAAAVVQAVPDEAARRAALVTSKTSAEAPARAIADRLNAKPVTAAPAAGKTALGAPRPRRAAVRSNERDRGR